MKVKLTGINPLAYNSPINDDWIIELSQLEFPIHSEAKEVLNKTLNISSFFVSLLNDSWNLEWFIYEEVKKIQD